MIADSTISNNLGGGLITNGPGAVARVGGTTITGNPTGVLAAGGSNITSFGTNRNFGNPTFSNANNGTFTATISQN
jgi:hypothetical protein